jgi:hypothetical protein
MTKLHHVLAAALVLGMSMPVGLWAVEIRKGATAEVHANSIWFQQAGQLARWQELKKAGNSAALKSYEDNVLSNRDAWQFINALSVEILGYDAAENRVRVRMKTPSRMLGTEWLLDAGALAQ